MKKKIEQQPISEDTKIIVTILTLIFVYPIGVIVMWFLTKWPRWAKILISLPLMIIPFLIVAFIVFMFIVYSNDKVKDAKTQKIINACLKQCENTPYPQDAICINSCTKKNKINYKRQYIPVTIIPTQAPSY